MDYVTLKWLHILSSTLLFGTGLGSAFYMFFVSLSREPRATAMVVKYVIIADWLFTTPTIIFQFVSGLYLAHLARFPLTSRWILWSLGLYLLAGACWLPVVWLQIRMRRFAQEAVNHDDELPALYWRYFVIWTLLGIPAFFALVIIFYLMVAKPV